MTDLLTHVLFVYTGMTVASWRYPRLRLFVPISMIGAVIPDLSKARIIIPAGVIETALGLPFSWTAIHRLGGTLAVLALVATFFPKRLRSRVFGALLFGASTAYLLDAGLIRANGVTPPYLYPIAWMPLPTAGLYLSSESWPALVSGSVAAAVWTINRVYVED